MLQLPQHAFEKLMIGDVIFDDERRAFVVDARAVDARLRPQPRNEGVGERSLATKRRHMKTQASRHEMTNLKVHDYQRPV